VSGWTFFFVCLGVAALTWQLFRIIDAIEAPAKRRRVLKGR